MLDTNDRGEDVGQPAHPGYLMKFVFMDGRDLTTKDVANQAGLDIGFVDQIIAGAADIDEPVARRLFKAFGSAAETLYRAQVEFNHYRENGVILPFSALPNLELPGTGF